MGTYAMIYSKIKYKLKETFTPTYIKIINESDNHNVDKNSETHFKVILVSKKFENITIIERHRMVYNCLQNLLERSIHALSLHLFSESEKHLHTNIAESPLCAKKNN